MAEASSSNSSSAQYLGVEIGGTKLQIVVGTEAGAILDRRRFTVDRAQGGAGIRRQIEQCVADWPRASALRGIGIGFGGPVDRDTGEICCSHQIEGWSEFPLRQWLETIAGVPVRVDNDANTAALGEAECGAGRGKDPVFYVTLGSGVGGGLIVGGSIYHGAKPGEAEIGHVRLDQLGNTLESRCSGWAVDDRIRGLCREHPQSLLARLTTGMSGGEARQLAPAVAQNDAVAQALLEETGRDLAFGLSHAVHLFHPEVIILGGGLSQTGDVLRATVKRHLAGFIMQAFLPGPEIRLAALGEDAVPVGALILARQAEKSLRSTPRSE